MSGLFHTVKVISITDQESATLYTGTITYQGGVVKQFVAAIPTSPAGLEQHGTLVVDENDNEHTVSLATNVIDHINNMNARKAS